MKTFTGKRNPNGSTEVWVLDGQGGRLLDPAPSLRVANHSPTGFEWGYQGSGPAQLALALLLEHTGDEELARMAHQMFKCEVVANWGQAWTVTGLSIDTWLSSHALAPRPMTAAEHNAFPKGRWS